MVLLTAFGAYAMQGRAALLSGLGGFVGYLKARDTASPVAPGYFDEEVETRAP